MHANLTISCLTEAHSSMSCWAWLVWKPNISIKMAAWSQRAIIKVTHIASDSFRCVVELHVPISAKTRRFRWMKFSWLELVRHETGKKWLQFHCRSVCTALANSFPYSTFLFLNPHQERACPLFTSLVCANSHTNGIIWEMKLQYFMQNGGIAKDDSKRGRYLCRGFWWADFACRLHRCWCWIQSHHIYCRSDTCHARCPDPTAELAWVYTRVFI